MRLASRTNYAMRDCMSMSRKRFRLSTKRSNSIADTGSTFLVENKVVIEVKAVEALNDVHLAQILTYLKLSDYKLGFLINFNVKRIKDGIRRVVNHLDD